jgi:hypothetical protein
LKPELFLIKRVVIPGQPAGWGNEYYFLTSGILAKVKQSGRAAWHALYFVAALIHRPRKSKGIAGH